MGIWKRVSEKTKQAMGLKANAAEWRPTSNDRNLAMIEEARRFSKQLKILHRELTDLQGRMDGHVAVLKTVLNSSLPRVYEMTDKGPVPLEKEASIVGNGVSFDVLLATPAELKSKLQNEVLSPLEQWQNAYRMIKVRNIKCEELRLELDAKRREAAGMAVSLDKQKSKASSAEIEKAAADAVKLASLASAAPSSASNKWEDAEFKLQKEEDKVARLAQRFRDVEEEVYTALLTLINDTKVLKQYAATALVVFQQSLVNAHSAFGTGIVAPIPLPSSTPNKLGVSPSNLNGALTAIPTSQGNVGPGTPEQVPQLCSQAPSERPIAPAWYNEAKKNGQPMNYDSDMDS